LGWGEKGGQLGGIVPGKTGAKTKKGIAGEESKIRAEQIQDGGALKLRKGEKRNNRALQACFSTKSIQT